MTVPQEGSEGLARLEAHSSNTRAYASRALQELYVVMAAELREAERRTRRAERRLERARRRAVKQRRQARRARRRASRAEAELAALRRSSLVRAAIAIRDRVGRAT